MGDVLLFIATLALAVLGSYLARWMHMPAGGMLGAMIAVAAFNLISNQAVFPQELRVFVQICSGAMIGSRIAKKDVIALKTIIVPTIILIFFMFLMNITIGIAMHLIGGLDIATAMFASSPGGMSDMALLAADMGANSSYVTLLQLIRQLTIYIFMPGIIKKTADRAAAKKQEEGAEQEELQMKQAAVKEEERVERSLKNLTWRFVLTFAIAAAGGFGLHFLGVTAGAMLGAMFATAAFNIFTGLVYFPPAARNYTQIFTGAFLGMKMDMESILGMASLLIPAGLEIVGVLGFASLTAWLIYKFTSLDFSVSLMASTPGGLQEMSILSEELGMDTPKIAVMQTSRLMTVVAVFPWMIQTISSLF